MRSCPIELGIFLPITDHGWVISTTAPQFAPSYDMNKRLALRCEEFGFDFAFSMVKWRGFGGEMGYWDQALEPMTLMASLAAVTTRMDLIASVQPLTFHPAVMARKWIAAKVRLRFVSRCRRGKEVARSRLCNTAGC